MIPPEKPAGISSLPGMIYQEAFIVKTPLAGTVTSSPTFAPGTSSIAH